MSRTGFAIKNTAAGVSSKVITLVLSFVSRTIFICLLGNEYLGINGLYSEVLSMLSFAELGFGSAMTFALYKPIAENDERTAARLTEYYKKVYRIVAIVIAALGVSLLPFLQYIVKGADSVTLRELRLYYLIFLFNTVVGYFVTYKYSVVNASQKNYIVTNIDMVVHSATVIFQIISLLVFRDFLIYLITQSLCLLLSRVFISLYLNRRVPILRVHCEEKLSREEKLPIFNNVRGLMVHQLSAIAVNSTDNIIISSFESMGVVTVGLVSNYNLIIKSVIDFVNILFSSVTAGLGNMVASDETENYRKSFLELNFMSFWIYGFCSIAFFVLIPPFITLWIGEENLIDTVSFALILVSVFLKGQMRTFTNARIAKGDFNRDKWWSLLEAVVNLVVSVIFASRFGLVGVYIGTVASRAVNILTRPAFVYRFLFERSCAEYYVRLAIYSLATAGACALTWLAVSPILSQVTVLRFLAAVCVTAVVPNAVFLLLFFRADEFRSLVSRLRSLLSQRRKKG